MQIKLFFIIFFYYIFYEIIFFFWHKLINFKDKESFNIYKFKIYISLFLSSA